MLKNKVHTIVFGYLIYKNINRDKLKDELSISYVEIAHRAIEIGRENLAKMLLDLEPNIAKKVPVLLWIESYDQALKNALISKDSNLINMVILKLLKSGSLGDKEIYELMK